MANNPPPTEPGYIDGDKRKGPSGRTLDEIVQDESGGKFKSARDLLSHTKRLAKVEDVR